MSGLEDGGRKPWPRITGSLEKPEKTHMDSPLEPLERSPALQSYSDCRLLRPTLAF